MIDITEAMVRALVAHLGKDFPIVVTGLSKPSDLVNEIHEGWSEPMDRLVLPSIVVDAPIPGERSGHTAKVIAQQRVDEAGVPSSDPADEDFLWTVALASLSVPLQVSVYADSKVARAEIDESIAVALRGDFHNGPPYVISDPAVDYYNQIFHFRQGGTVKHFDSATPAGREEFTSLREVNGDGAEVIQHIAASFTDLSVGLKVTEMGRDFDLVPSEPFTLFDPTTP